MIQLFKPKEKTPDEVLIAETRELLKQVNKKLKILQGRDYKFSIDQEFTGGGISFELNIRKYF